MKSAVAIFVVFGCASAFAVMGTLTSQSVNGSLRYCKYSNGVIVTVNSYELCPVTNG